MAWAGPLAVLVSLSLLWVCRRSREAGMIKIAWLIGAFALCFAVGGWIFWRGSYEEFISMGPPWLMFGRMVAVAVLLSWIGGIGILPCGIVVGSSFPAVVLVRVVLDCAANPTNHNLWPFELVVGTGLGMIVAFSAAAVGWTLRRFIGARSNRSCHWTR
jgi:hypothetical protein